MKKAVMSFTVLLTMLIVTSVSALAAESSKTPAKQSSLSSNIRYSGYEYLLDSYDINVIVNENNTFTITEHIGAYFNVSKHGIFRKIPLKNKVERLDGTTSYNRAKITDISVDAPYHNFRIGRIQSLKNRG